MVAKRRRMVREPRQWRVSSEAASSWLCHYDANLRTEMLKKSGRMFLGRKDPICLMFLNSQESAGRGCDVGVKN